MPLVSGDFTVEKGAVLYLNKSTFVVLGDYHGNGRIDGDHGMLSVDGRLYNGTGDGLQSAILDGDLTVSVSLGIVNRALIASGQSPGTLTRND